MSAPPRDTESPRRSNHGRRGFRRLAARLILITVAAFATLFFISPGVAQAACSDDEWHNDFKECLSELETPPTSSCKEPPVASSPDSGMAGWFAQGPEWLNDPDFRDGKFTVPQGSYTTYGYAGYDLPVFAQDCIGDLVPDADSAGNDLASLEFTLATGIIGASNGLREAAWTPAGMWGWANDFLDTASQAIYEKVFSVFGAITIALVGMYLIWRSRQADMSMAVTTTGWAVLILILVTAVARWPVESATFADEGLTASLSVVQDAIGPESSEQCESGCRDLRTPAQRASDMATGEVLYHNWLRATLGKSEDVVYERNSDGDIVYDDDGEPVVTGGNVAYKYGPALFDAQAMTWAEIDESRNSPEDRQRIIAGKQEQWLKVAAAIEREDPEAYATLTGARGWDRVGTGFLALLSAIFFAAFDITASILIILGFLLIRWAVVAIPLIGTIAILRPASGGFKRLVSMVVAAVINVVVFGVAAAVYLFAVSHVLSASIPGWLQVILIGLLGLVAWMVLRPYRRIASLRGGSTLAEAAFGRRRANVEVKNKTVVNNNEKVRTESAKEEAPETRAETREPAAAKASDNVSSGLPARPTPGRDTSSAGRSRPGYSIYRPSTAPRREAGDRPMVSVRPD